MASLTFPYDHSRDPMQPDQLADLIATQFNLTTLPQVDINPTQIVVTHPQATEAQRAAVQAIINAYVFDPIWGGGVRAVLEARAQAGLDKNAAFLALPVPVIAPTLAQLQDLWRQVQVLTKENTAVIRLATNRIDSTSGT